MSSQFPSHTPETGAPQNAALQRLGSADRRAASGTSADTIGEIDIRGAFQFVWRSKWYIGLFSLLLSAALGYVAFSMLDTRYTSQVRLAMNVQGQSIVNLESLVSGVSTEQAAINTELEVLMSSGVLEILVDDLDLTADPEFNSDLREETFGLDTVKDYVKQLIGLEIEEDDGDRAAEDVLTRVINAVRARVSVSAKSNTYVLVISATSTDDEKSKRIANRLAEIYIQNQVDLKLEAAEYAIEWLVERISVLEDEVDQKQQDINDLRSAGDLVSLEALEALRIQLQQRRGRLDTIESDIAKTLQRIAQLEAFTPQTDLAIGIDDDVLAQLVERSAAPGAAPVQAQIDARVDLLRSEAESQIARLEDQKRALQNSMDELLIRIDAQNATLQDLAKLEREVDASRLLFDTFVSRLKEASLQASLQLPDARILTRATSGTPVSPRRTLIVIAGFLLGGLLGLVFAYTRDKSHRTFVTPEQLESVTKYPILGQVPKIAIRRRSNVLRYFRENRVSGASEALRNLRTSIMMTNVEKPPQVVMVSSSVPGEGKTTLALVLALQLAEMGKKVLLLDGDIRRKTLQQYFKEDGKHGLLDVLDKDVALKDAIVTPSDLPGVHVLMGDPKDRNAADIWSSSAFSKLIGEVRAEYDHVIIDSPPVLLVPDARILSIYADATVFSVAWNNTSRAQVLRALKEFEITGREVTGIVFSKIDPKGLAQYGYDGAYGYNNAYYGARS